MAPDQSSRELLLDAALRVYARSGIRGATTKRIAQEAGLNEVTLFRHFGSKDALVHEALAWGAERVQHGALPDVPSDPAVELLGFCLAQHRGLSEARSLIRTCLGEFEEHPDATSMATRAPERTGEALETYLERLREAGLASGTWSARIAAQMLMGTLFADAMGRDCMPSRYPASEQDTVREYVALFLRAIGANARSDGATRPLTATDERTDR